MARFKKSMFKSKSFLVVDGELFLKITRTKKWYVVEGLNTEGLVTQGRSIEEAIYMAHDAAKLLAECRAEIAAEKARQKKAKVKPPAPRRQLATAV